MANIKEPVTTHECILMYAVTEHLKQEVEDSKLTVLPVPSQYGSKIEALATAWRVSRHVTNRAILN